MLLSTPRTFQPSRSKNAAASEPISPLLPVIKTDLFISVVPSPDHDSFRQLKYSASHQLPLFSSNVQQREVNWVWAAFAGLFGIEIEEVPRHAFPGQHRFGHEARLLREVGGTSA